MGKDPAKTEYKQRFMARVRWARLGRRYTQEGIAELLNISQDKYKQYEVRSYLPHDLVPKFCLATGIDAAWLFTEKGQAPAIAEPPVESAQHQKSNRHKRKAA